VNEKKIQELSNGDRQLTSEEALYLQDRTPVSYLRTSSSRDRLAVRRPKTSRDVVSVGVTVRVDTASAISGDGG
jgi:hypothetical protein